jgi:hypothetical protein
MKPAGLIAAFVCLCYTLANFSKIAKLHIQGIKVNNAVIHAQVSNEGDNLVPVGKKWQMSLL